MRVRMAVAVLVAVAGVWVTACGGPPKSHACTAIGCNSGAWLDVSPFLAARAATTLDTQLCVSLNAAGDTKDKCTTRSFEKGAPTQQLSVEVSGDSPVSFVAAKVRVTDPTGQVVVEESIPWPAMQKVQPNGPRCPGTCYQSHLHLTAEGRLQQSGSQ